MKIKIQERKIALDAARKAVKDHCMCARFYETPHHVMVHYPEGYFPEGTRVAVGKGGKVKALETLVSYMEKHWKESFA